MNQKGLAGIRVLDFSGQIAGPYCSKLFVDGGAEVVKVEPPEGDPLRRWSATGRRPAWRRLGSLHLSECRQAVRRRTIADPRERKGGGRRSRRRYAGPM